MKQNQITDLPNLDIESIENIFNVYRDGNGMYFYNLLQTVVFPPNLPSNLFVSYIVKYGDSWPYISFKTIGTPNLWWLILLANKIMDPTKIPVAGNTILIPKDSVVKQVLSQIG